MSMPVRATRANLGDQAAGRTLLTVKRSAGSLVNWTRRSCSGARSRAAAKRHGGREIECNQGCGEGLPEA